MASFLSLCGPAKNELRKRFTQDWESDIRRMLAKDDGTVQSWSKINDPVEDERKLTC
jgi:hypothetical protein